MTALFNRQNRQPNKFYGFCLHIFSFRLFTQYRLEICSPNNVLHSFHKSQFLVLKVKYTIEVKINLRFNKDISIQISELQ
jgi:hypothetical protein